MDQRISIRRREMDPKMLNCTDKNRFQMLHASSDVEHEQNHTFLKVSPALFTQDKLPLFDSLDLYTSLIKCSKFMEQGERLHNLSWRIINKSLLKDQNINKSKRRDGVRNLYHVINPIKQTHLFPQLQQQLQKPKAVTPASPKTPTTMVTAASTSATSSGSSSALLTPISSGASIPKSTANTHITSTRPHISISKKLISPVCSSPEPLPTKMEVPSRSQANTPDLRKDLAKKKFAISPELVNVPKNHQQQLPLPPSSSEPPVSNHVPLSETKSNAHSQTSLFSRNPSSKSLFAKNQPTPFTPANGSTNSSANGSAENLKSNEMNHSSRTSSVANNIAHTSSNGTKSGTSGTISNAAHVHAGQDHKNMFFSSEDEESDWDSLSDDSEIYDEEEDNDQYYENQWDKLMFSKTHQNNNVHQVPSKESGEKKSLLSGLFMQEKQTKSQVDPEDKAYTTTNEDLLKRPLYVSEATSSAKAVEKPVLKSLDKQSEKPLRKKTDQNCILHQNPTGIQIPPQPVAPETTEIVAVGSVTPSSSWQNKPLLDHQKPIPVAFERSRRLGSFSSIVSDTTRERYYHESNAPPAAQTILPTALSTHMFLPNNVHQQRMALRGESLQSDFDTEIAKKVASRRESMDIPSKNRNNFFLKTRMEISEEESFARAYGRCVKK